MKDYFTAHFPLHSETFAPYADLFAMVLCLVITGKCKYGKKNMAILRKSTKIEKYFLSLS